MISVSGPSTFVVTPLTTLRFVDAGTASTSRDGSIDNPYNQISEALTNITDATTSKRYALIVSPGTYAGFIAKPFISVVGSILNGVTTGIITITDTAGDYFFENLQFPNTLNTSLELALNITFNNCIFTLQNIFRSGAPASLTIFNLKGCEFQNTVSFDQIPANCFDTKFLSSITLDDNSLTIKDYVFNGCEFAGAMIGIGSTPSNSFLFVNCSWGGSSTFSTAYTFNITTDSNSFPFLSAANVTITKRLSISELSDYDNTTGMVATNVQAALDELKLTRGLPNQFVITSLQDILDIPGVVQTVNDIDVTALGSFTFLIRGAVDIGLNRLVCEGDTSQVVTILGQNQALDILISSNTTEMFFFEDCTVLVRWMNVFATSATNGVFNISNTAGNEKTNSFQMFNTFINFSIGGTFTDLATASIFLPSFFGNSSDGFRFFGGFTRIAIQDIQFENYTGTAIDLGTATFDSIAILASTDLPSASNVFLSGAANSANLNTGGQGVVSNIRFEGTFTPTLVGITVQDLQWDFNNNPPLLNSFEAGFFNLGTTALTSVPLQNTYVKIAGTTTAFGSNSRVTQTANNEFQWDSLTPRPIVISAQASFTKTGAEEEYEITVFKDDGGGGGFVIIDATIRGCGELKSATEQISVAVPDTPSPGDKYSIFVQCTTAAGADLTAQCMQVEIR